MRTGKTILGLMLAVVVVIAFDAYLYGDEPASGEGSGPRGPSALVASGDGRTLFVANTDARQVAVVDVGRRRAVATIDVPATPTGLALHPDGKTLYVTCAAPRSQVLAIDTATHARHWQRAAGHTAMAPLLTPDGRRLFVCNRFDADVAVLDADNGRQIARVPVTREPIAAAVTPNGRTVVVANHLPLAPSTALLVAAVVTLIDTASLATETIELPDGSTGLRDVCVTPDGRYALVTHLLGNYTLVASHLDQGWMNTNSLSVIDLAERRLLGNVLLDDLDHGAANPWGVALSHDGATICTTHAGSHELSLMKTASVLTRVRREGEFRGPMSDPSAVPGCRRRVALPGRGPRDLVVVGSHAYVAEYFSDTLAVVCLDPPCPGPHVSDRQPPPGSVNTTASPESVTVDNTQPATIPLGPSPTVSPARRGEMLFHDAGYCYQQWQSCASCHPGGRADALNWDLLNDGIGNPKNTKSMLLAHRTPPAMISGVRATAELAVRAGMEHILFADRCETDASDIDVYLKSLRPVPSPWLVDGRWSPAAERGKILFEDSGVGCVKCHPAPLYTDLKRHRVDPPGTDEHLAFDTPTLIEAWRTAPYLHDGRYVTIRELLVEGRHGRTRGGVQDLSPPQIDDLIEFVLSL